MYTKGYCDWQESFPRVTWPHSRIHLQERLHQELVSERDGCSALRAELEQVTSQVEALEKTAHTADTQVTHACIS